MPLADMYPGQREQGRFVQQEIQTIAGELGLPFGKRKMIYNSRRSQELASLGGYPGGRPATSRCAIRRLFRGQLGYQ